MSADTAILVFLVCLIVMLTSSEVLVRGLTVLGVKLTLTEGFVGLLAALGADAPEISAAITSLFAGAADLGRGVVLGSNLFNLAMLLGLSAVIAGQVRIRRQALLLDATIGVSTLLIVASLLLGLLAPLVAFVLLVVLLAPYLVLIGLHPGRVEHLTLPDSLAHLLAKAASQIHEEDTKPHHIQGSWILVALVPFALIVIVLASVGLVNAAVTISHAWQLPQALVGGVILAALTSLPNAYAAVHLALHGRGAAVVSATANSNTINLVIGLALPALIIGMHGAARGVFVELGWLLAMTMIGFLLLLPARGMTRLGGAAMIFLYLIFVVVHLIWPTI